MSDYDPRPLPFYGPLLPGGDLSNLRNNEKMSSLPGPITQMDGAIEATEPTSSAAIPLPAPDSMAYNLSHAGFFNENNDENGHRYVGLVNQAMTCYLNSLIQTLYMTPEFRNAIYKWKFNGNSNEESKSIPFQLQKLFLLLQTSDKHSLETKELTNSFGWESTEAYDQHDVQELCRLMFDALEKKWRNSENKSLIQDLYKGSMQDYVKCTNCKTEKIREDSFLDLPLAVKPFGANEAYKSIEEALKAFVEPEILNGANQYECEKCKSKQDAEKGLRITKFPYNLAIQLKRFDFDYNTLHRIKLNDRMTFPDILNLNNFIRDTSTCKPSTSKEPPKISYASIAAKKSPPPQTIKEDEELDLGKAETMWLNEPVDSEVVKNLLAKGEYVYELFSVMVHQGSASGGHYYAYIKNMDKNSWFCFNDSLVQRATIEEIQKTFGGSSGGWSNSNTNAYMLMYRKIEPPKNAHFIRTSELPLHLVELKEKWIREEEEKDLQQRRQESLVKVNITCNHERTLMDHPIPLMIPRETSMADVVAQALDQFEHLKLLPENCRLIECSSSFDKLNEAIEDLEKKILDDYAPTYYSYLVRPEVYFMIDTKPTHEQPWFEVSKQNSYRQVDLFLVDLETEEIRPIKKLVFHENKTVGEFKQLICSLIPSLAEPASNFLHCRLVVDDEIDENASLSILDLPDISFGKCIKRAYMVAKIYVDGGCHDILEEDRKIEDAKETKFMKMLERKKFSMRIKIVLPTDTEYRQACMIPPTEREEIAKASDNLQRSHSSLTMVSLPETSLQLTPNTKILNLSSSQPKSSALEHFPLMEGNSHGLSSMSVCNLSPHYETGYPDMCSTSDWQKHSAEQGSSGRNSPLSAAFDDDEGMDMSSIGTSPKRSPVVSDAGEISDNDNAFMSVTEQLHSEVNSRLMAIERMRSSRDQEFETETQTDSACETLIGGTETTSESVASIPYTTSIVSVDENGENKCVEVEADRRSLVVHFKTWIAQYLNLDSANFILVKHYNETDDGYESNVINETETLREYAQTINHLGIKLVGFQLASHEKLIRVCEYDVHNDDQEQWAPLFLLPASKSTSVQEFLEKCQAYLKNVYKSEYTLEQLRLRDLSEHGAVVMQLTDTLEVRGQQWSKNLYLQKIPEEQLSFSRGDPVIVRQWYPSKLEVGKVFEVFLPPGTSNLTKELRRILAQRTGLPIERIELSDAFPDKCWTKWPYSKGILELAEKVRFSTEILSPETGFVGKLVYFKDKNEFTKNISDDEKRAIRIKEQSVNVTRSTWRRERPLRIQMSSVSEDN